MKKRVASILVIVIAFIAVIITEIDVFAAEPQAPELYLYDTTIAWTSGGNPVQFTIIVDGVDQQTMGPYADSFDLKNLNLRSGIYYTITLRADFHLGDGLMPVLLSKTSNPVYFYGVAMQQLPTPYIWIEGTDIRIELDRQDIPRQVYEDIEFIVYLDDYAENRRVSGDFNISYFNLSSGSHHIALRATVGEEGWLDSSKSNELRITAPNELQMGRLTVSQETVRVGEDVTVTIAGLAYVKRLEIITEGRGGINNLEYTDRNPERRVSRQITLDNVNIDTIRVIAYGEYDTVAEKTFPVTVTPMPAIQPIIEIGPSFSQNPIVPENGIGVLLEWNALPNNNYGYRVFRATSDTSEGVSISEEPITSNSAYYGLVTFDANVQAGNSYWYYIREVRQTYPEVLGAPGLRLRVDIPAASTIRPNVQRGFVMMIIGNPKMNNNNNWKYVDSASNTAPTITDGRTMIPLRAVVEAMGGEVNWDGNNRRVELRLHGNYVQMWLGRRAVNVNGETRQMDVAPQIINGKTLIPARYVAEFLGAYVAWVPQHNMVLIAYDL